MTAISNYVDINVTDECGTDLRLHLMKYWIPEPQEIVIFNTELKPLITTLDKWEFAIQ